MLVREGKSITSRDPDYRKKFLNPKDFDVIANGAITNQNMFRIVFVCLEHLMVFKLPSFHGRKPPAASRWFFPLTHPKLMRIHGSHMILDVDCVNSEVLTHYSIYVSSTGTCLQIQLLISNSYMLSPELSIQMLKDMFPAS